MEWALASASAWRTRVFGFGFSNEYAMHNANGSITFDCNLFDSFSLRNFFKMKIFIFDLDETLIDSAHRTPNNPDGTLNLAAYMANHTPENVAKDSLLPLAKYFHALKNSGARIWILTARDMLPCDYEFLERNGITAHKIMSRDKAKPGHYACKDGDYKRRWIQPLLNLRQFAKAHWIIFDDAAPVLTAMRKLGLTAINAKKVNARIA